MDYVMEAGCGGRLVMAAKRGAVGAAWLVLGSLALAAAATGQTKALKAYEPEKRMALVIGNEKYKSNPLNTPVADAELIGETLKDLGFDIVLIKKNLETRRAMVRAVREFKEKLGSEDTALFYYSGHGTQAVGGDSGGMKNYLLPTEYDSDTPEEDVEFEALSFEWVRRYLDDAKARVLVLDACRNKMGKSIAGGVGTDERRARGIDRVRDGVGEDSEGHGGVRGGTGEGAQAARGGCAGRIPERDGQCA